MYHLRTRRLIKEIAKENNITVEQAENIITTMFEATRYFMTRPEYRETYEFPIIFVPGFCRFYPSRNVIKKIKEYKEKKNNLENKEKDESI